MVDLVFCTHHNQSVSGLEGHLGAWIHQHLFFAAFDSENQRTAALTYPRVLDGLSGYLTIDGYVQLLDPKLDGTARHNDVEHLSQFRLHGHQGQSLRTHGLGCDDRVSTSESQFAF